MGTGDFLLDGAVLGRLLLAATIGTWALVVGGRLLRVHIRRARVRRELAKVAHLYPKGVVPRPTRASRSAGDQERAHVVALRGVPQGNGRATDPMTSSLADDLRSSLHRRMH